MDKNTTLLQIPMQGVVIYDAIFPPSPAIPPHVPLVSSADDMSNFDKFEPEKDNLRFPDLSSKNQRSFSGKSLPFVGFTFTRFESDYIDR